MRIEFSNVIMSVNLTQATIINPNTPDFAHISMVECGNIFDRKSDHVFHHNRERFQWYWGAWKVERKLNKINVKYQYIENLNWFLNEKHLPINVILWWAFYVTLESYPSNGEYRLKPIVFNRLINMKQFDRL